MNTSTDRTITRLVTLHLALTAVVVGLTLWTLWNMATDPTWLNVLAALWMGFLARRNIHDHAVMRWSE